MKNFLKYIIISSVLFYSNIGLSKSPPLGTGTGDVPANILIMLDNSGSMAWGLLDRPVDVALDSSGNVYVLEYVKGQISIFDSSKNLLRICGNNTQGYSLSNPQQLTIYSDYIYVADTGNSRIAVINKNTCRLEKTLDTSYVGSPTVIAASANYLYVNAGCYFFVYNRSLPLSKLNISNLSSNVQYWSGCSGNNPLIYYVGYATGINVSNSEILIAGTSGTVTRSIDSNGRVSTGINRRIGTVAYSSSNGYFGPGRRDAVFDSGGNIYITDVYNYRIQKFTSSNVYSTKVGTPSNTIPFNTPYSIATDSGNNQYVADFTANKVYKFNSSLSLTDTFFGGGDTEVSGSKNRLDIAKNVIKKIVSNSDLNSGANFGLLEWGWNYRLSTSATAAGGLRLRVPISSVGAPTIVNDVDKIIANGATYLDAALNLAKNYFNSGTNQSVNSIFHPSPIDRNAFCQLNYLIVISDGEWENHSNVLSIADSLNNQIPSIKTFVVGFALGTTSTNYTELAEKGGTNIPLYADNESELLANLTAAISQILSARLSFTNPVPISQADGEFVYQSTFKYESNKQWEGNLKKYKLVNSSISGDSIWDAAEKLNQKSAASRNLWTVGLSAAGLNNFTTTYNSELQGKFISSYVNSTSLADKLINFVRGVDTYDQDNDGNVTEERHKLNDIYHSQPVIVKKPQLITTNNSYVSIYSDTYYKLQNNYNNFVSNNFCGGVCANRKEILLAGSNSGVLHAFDTSTGEELWGFIPPSILNKLPKMISSTRSYTNSIYAIDGSTQVKDIYYNGSWKTVSITGLGRGGNSYFVLDVTNTSSPKHLFTVENDDFNKMVKFWDADGTLTTHLYGSGAVSNPEKDYSKLGETWSAPVILRLKISGVDKWVAIFGGGFNGGTNSSLGSAVFVMDLENGGNLLKKIDIQDLPANDVINSVPANLSVITANGTELAEYYGGIVYVADYEGKITKINLTSNGTLYEQTQLFSTEATVANGRYMFHAVEPAMVNGNIWLYFGTGNMQKIQDQTTSIQNRLYGIKDVNFPNFASVSSGTIAQCKKTNSSSDLCPTSADLGWYVDLANSQKITAQPTVSSNNETVYFSVYQPSTGSTICEAGDAILNTSSPTCGKSTSEIVGKGVLTKAVTIGNNIVLGISGNTNLASGSQLSNKDNLIISKQAGNPLSLITIETWREN